MRHATRCVGTSYMNYMRRTHPYGHIQSETYALRYAGSLVAKTSMQMSRATDDCATCRDETRERV